MDSIITLNLLGEGGISRIAIDIINNYYPDIKRIEIFDDSEQKIGSTYKNILVKEKIKSFIKSANNEKYYLNCLGNIFAIKTRIEYSKKLQSLGAHALNVIHPKAVLSIDSVKGKGNFICANVVINTNASLGNENVLFSNSAVEHDSQIGNFCYISPGATICGKVKIEDNVYIGPNAVITAGISIGKNTIIGAGSVVLDNLPSDSVYVGNPAKYLKPNQMWGDV